jgi:hypothetical protein
MLNELKNSNDDVRVVHLEEVKRKNGLAKTVVNGDENKTELDHG